MRTWRRLAAVLTVVVLVAAACGRDDDGGGSAGGGEEPGELVPVPGFDGTTITVGAITPDTGLASILGKPLTAGNQVYFDRVNAAGGIAGKYPVRVVVGDSQYNNNVALQAYAGMREQVVMLVQVLGTAITNAVLPQLEADDMTAAPATLDAEWVREAQLVPTGGPYQIEAINSLDWYERNGGRGKTVCVIHQDDLYGQAGLEGVRFAAANGVDVKVGTVATFRATDTEFTAQIQQVRSGCDAVFLAALPTTARAILAAAASPPLPVQWIVLAPGWISLLAAGDLGAYTTKNMVLVAEGPAWGDVSVPGMKQLVDDVARFRPAQQPDLYFLFGYAQAWTVAEVLEKAVARGDLSRAGIQEALEDLGEVSTDGLLGDYVYGPPDERVPPRASTVFAVDPSVPGALRALETNFVSDAAEEYDFDR